MKIYPQGDLVGSEHHHAQEGPDQVERLGHGLDRLVDPAGCLARPVVRALVDFRAEDPDHQDGRVDCLGGRVDCVPADYPVALVLQADLEGRLDRVLADCQVRVQARLDAPAPDRDAVVLLTMKSTKTKKSPCVLAACRAVGHALEAYLAQVLEPDPDRRAALADCLLQGLVLGLGRLAVLVGCQVEDLGHDPHHRAALVDCPPVGRVPAALLMMKSTKTKKSPCVLVACRVVGHVLEDCQVQGLDHRRVPVACQVEDLVRRAVQAACQALDPGRRAVQAACQALDPGRRAVQAACQVQGLGRRLVLAACQVLDPGRRAVLAACQVQGLDRLHALAACQVQDPGRRAVLAACQVQGLDRLHALAACQAPSLDRLHALVERPLPNLDRLHALAACRVGLGLDHRLDLVDNLA